MRYVTGPVSDQGEFDLGSCQEDVDQLFDRLDGLTQTERARHALKIAAAMLEYSAYEMAGNHEAAQVANLIDCAAELDRASCDLAEDDTGCINPGLNNLN